MGWWDRLTSFASGLSSNVGTLQNLLRDYIKDYAKWGASHADDYFNILRHTWSDVTYLVDHATDGYYDSVSDFYGSLTGRLESSYSILGKSWYNVTNYVDGKVGTLSTTVSTISSKVSTLYTYAHTTLNNRINSLSQDIDNIVDDVDGITRTAIKTVSFIAYEAEKRWGILKKSWSDIINLINSNINSLKTDIINPLSVNLTKVAGQVDTLVNTTIKNINTTVTGLEKNLNKLQFDIVNPIRIDLNDLIFRINKFPTWISKSFDTISNDFIEQFIKVFTASERTSVRFLTALGIGAGEVITTILDTPRDMVNWIKNDIADVFEDILDRVFR